MRQRGNSDMRRDRQGANWRSSVLNVFTKIRDGEYWIFLVFGGIFKSKRLSVDSLLSRHVTPHRRAGNRAHSESRTPDGDIPAFARNERKAARLSDDRPKN